MFSQQDMIKQQDEQLDEIGNIANRLVHHAGSINDELKMQEHMLKRMEDDVDKNLEKMNFVMKKLGKLLKTSDTKTLCTIICLLVTLVVLMMLVFYT
jgi:predicted PurR-regulated permease PerM